LAKFDFHQNHRARIGAGDAARAPRILKGAEGERLTFVLLTKERALRGLNRPGISKVGTIVFVARLHGTEKLPDAARR
jgi:hypothetical protein